MPFVVFLFVLLCASGVAQAQHELGLTLGYMVPTERGGSPARVRLSDGVALQANYGFRILERRRVSLYVETHFLANSLRDIESVDRRVTRDVATLYVTPGLRVRFSAPYSFAPYVVAGGGYALYEQSFFTLSGASNPAPRFTHRGTAVWGGGVDRKLWRFVGVRVEARDFYSGNPSFNIQPDGGGQHNLVVGGGFVLRFGASQ